MSRNFGIGGLSLALRRGNVANLSAALFVSRPIKLVSIRDSGGGAVVDGEPSLEGRRPSEERRSSRRGVVDSDLGGAGGVGGGLVGVTGLERLITEAWRPVATKILALGGAETLTVRRTVIGLSAGVLQDRRFDVCRLSVAGFGGTTGRPELR